MWLKVIDFGVQHRETLILIACALLFTLFAKGILNSLHQRFEKQNKIWSLSFVEALYKPLSWFVWLFAIAYTIDLLFPGFIFHYHVVKITGVVCAVWFVMRWKKALIRLLTTKGKGKLAGDRSRIDVIDKAVTMLVLFLALLFLLEVTGNSVTTLIAFGGIGGLAIAFASQEIIANYFSGIMIYANRPFSIGDWIDLPERQIEGHVEEIGWYMTRIRTFDKRPIYVPNAIFSKMIVVTPSRMSHRHIKEKLHLRYQDAKAVQPIIEAITLMLHSNPAVDPAQRVLVNLENFGSYSLEVAISAYTTTIEGDDFAAIKQDILLRILEILKHYGAEIAIPSSKT